MKKILLSVLFLSGIFFASADNIATSFDSVWANVFEQLINPIFTLMIVVTSTYFLWGIVTFIYNLREGSGEDVLNDGKRHMLWGGIGLFIIVSISGIIKLLNNLIGGWFGL